MTFFYGLLQERTDELKLETDEYNILSEIGMSCWL